MAVEQDERRPGASMTDAERHLSHVDLLEGEALEEAHRRLLLRLRRLTDVVGPPVP